MLTDNSYKALQEGVRKALNVIMPEADESKTMDDETFFHKNWALISEVQRHHDEREKVIKTMAERQAQIEATLASLTKQTAMAPSPIPNSAIYEPIVSPDVESLQRNLDSQNQTAAKVSPSNILEEHSSQ